MLVKRYLKIAGLLFLIQLLILVFNTYSFQNDISILGIKLSSINGILVSVISFPAKLISPELPFYAQDISVLILTLILNLGVQAIIVTFLLNQIRK